MVSRNTRKSLDNVLFYLFDAKITKIFKKLKYLFEVSHSSLLRTFGFSAASTYDSYLPLIFGKFALI